MQCVCIHKDLHRIAICVRELRKNDRRGVKSLSFSRNMSRRILANYYIENLRTITGRRKKPDISRFFRGPWNRQFCGWQCFSSDATYFRRAWYSPLGYSGWTQTVVIWKTLRLGFPSSVRRRDRCTRTGDRRICCQNHNRCCKKGNNRIISFFFLNPISWCLFNDFVFSGFDMNVCWFQIIEFLLARNTMIRDFHVRYFTEKHT